MSPGADGAASSLSDDTYGDFELIASRRTRTGPPTPGFYLRKQAPTRTTGSNAWSTIVSPARLAGSTATASGGFHAVPFAIDARYDVKADPVGCGPTTPPTDDGRFSDSGSGIC